GFGRACVLATVPLTFVAVALSSERILGFNPFVRSGLSTWGMGVVLLVGTPVANVFWYTSPDDLALGYLVLPWAALLAACAGAWYRPGVGREVRLSTTALLLAFGVFATLPLFVGGDSESIGIRVV